jgi:hypothetical protein
MAEVLISDITTGAVTGTGVFDLLMSSISAQLTTERNAGRITNTDYATIYTASMASALATANAFVLGKQAADKQADLLSEQIETQIAQTAQAEAQTTLLITQNVSALAQIDLINQKVKTEKAQILNVVDGVSVVGLMGVQKDLYNKQIDGYQRDAEQKLAKILADRWSLSRSTDSGYSEVGTGLENNNIKAVLNKAFAGINVTQI